MDIKYISVYEAAKKKGCSRDTIHKWIEQGRVNTIKISTRKFVVDDRKFQSLKLQEGTLMEPVESAVIKLQRRVDELEARLAKLEKFKK